MRHAFDLRSLPATPWKNGGGLTREIVCQPPGASVQHFDWRVSLAHIAADGPFSAFPGIDRVITLLAGDGVQLSDGQTLEHRLDEPFAPFAFPGEASIEARLLGGPCLDLNVMTRRAACAARVRVLRQSARTEHEDPAGAPGFLGEVVLALKGRWRIHCGIQQAGGTSDPGETFELNPEEGLWCAGEASMARLECIAKPGEDPVLIHILIARNPA